MNETCGMCDQPAITTVVVHVDNATGTFSTCATHVIDTFMTIVATVEQCADNPFDKAIATLSGLARIEATPYLEESHWFLAKAFLKKQDLVSAQKELETVVTLNGPHLDEARRDLEAVRRLARQ